MKKWNLIFDVERCTSCNNCVLATKDEYAGNHFAGYSAPASDDGQLWLKLMRHERGKHPMIDVSHYIESCQQCVNAPCINATTRDVISQRDDGIVVIDPVKAQGRKDLVGACPFGQIHWNEAQNVAQKWSFDAHLLDNGWSQPRCSQVCPTQALIAVKESDVEIEQRVKQDALVSLHPQAEVGSRIWYKNFKRVTHCFLGGTVLTKHNDVEDCAEGVAVKLYSEDGTLIAEQISDAFGEFKFEDLAGKGECYKLDVCKVGQPNPLSVEVLLSGSMYIGHIHIS